MERLTPLSVSFLDAEDVDASASLAIGSLAIFAGPAPEFEDFLTSIAERLPLLPRYRQKLRRAPIDLVAPEWVDDPDFDVHAHVRRTTVAAPAGRREIGALMSWVMARRMDRDRPLWEYWFCEGLPDDRWAVLSKLHHSVADGVSGTDLYTLVLDPTPHPPEPPVDRWDPKPVGSTRLFAATAARNLMTAPRRAIRQIGAFVAEPRTLVSSVATTTDGLAQLATAARPVRATSVVGPLGGGRRYAWTETSLEALRPLRHARGVSVNDVALAAITGGFQQLLLGRGEVLAARSLRTLVPVSTRVPGEEAITDNRVSLLLPYLPVDIADPLERLDEVHRRVRALQSRHEAEAGAVVTALAGHAPFLPVSWGVRLALRLPQRQIATVTTNVPGPRQTLYSLGRELEQVLPYVPIADRVRIGIAIFSYRDALVFGITGDHDAAPDLDVLADGIARSVAELVDAAS
ncbi:MAG: wax ester/triacylglycerol synthase family O-acyltransferase [Propionibacteriales bacterium]|nr:wax ester/triacylglycerol synthase family O-acyltransferase [Propionibacteriales bacterium]